MQYLRPLHCALGAPLRFAIIAIATAMLASGCAATSTAPSRVAGPPVPVAGEPPALPAPTPQLAKFAVEADGFPAQLAPRNRSAVADDPREPWSPNYGVEKPSGRDRWQPAVSSSAVAVEPVPTVRAIPRPIDPDDIIRRAIAEHEMRQRE